MSERSTRDVIPGLGAAMRAARERVGLTLADVAEQIGTGPAAVSKVELEQRAPSARLLVEYARALGVTVDSLVEAASFAPAGTTPPVPES